MNYPEEIWVDTDLVGDDKLHATWQKYRKVEDVPVVPKGMKYTKTEFIDGIPVYCFIENK